MPYLREEHDKVLDLSKKYECRDAIQKTNSKLTSLIFNIPMQHSKEKGHKRWSFLLQGRRDIEFCIFFMEGLTAKFLNTPLFLKKGEKTPLITGKVFRLGGKKTSVIH